MRVRSCCESEWAKTLRSSKLTIAGWEKLGWVDQFNQGKSPKHPSKKRMAKLSGHQTKLQKSKFLAVWKDQVWSKKSILIIDFNWRWLAFCLYLLSFVKDKNGAVLSLNWVTFWNEAYLPRLLIENTSTLNVYYAKSQRSHEQNHKIYSAEKEKKIKQKDLEQNLKERRPENFKQQHAYPLFALA